MIALLYFLLRLLASPFRSTTSRLEAENAALRHQLIALRRKVRGRVEFTNSDRLFFILLYRWFPSILNTITIIRPETLVLWHRARFRRYWRRKSLGIQEVARQSTRKCGHYEAEGCSGFEIDDSASRCESQTGQIFGNDTY